VPRSLDALLTEVGCQAGRVAATVDPGGQVAEENEANNAASATIDCGL
jgi:hypothetical protein